MSRPIEESDRTSNKINYVLMLACLRGEVDDHDVERFYEYHTGTEDHYLEIEAVFERTFGIELWPDGRPGIDESEIWVC